jgi:hypothetical protein
MSRTVNKGLRATRAWRRAAALLCAVLALVTAVNACEGNGGNGGFQLNQSGGAVGAGNYTGPGVPADFSGFVGPSSAPVTLLSATLLPLVGFPVPRLAHLGVYMITDHGDIPQANYWPPRTQPPHRGDPPYVLPVSAFSGYRVSPGRHPLLLIFYSFVGTRPGVNYFAAGLRITYQVGQSKYTGNWYAFGDSCVASNWALVGVTPRSRCNSADSAQAKRAFDAYSRLAGQG